MREGVLILSTQRLMYGLADTGHRRNVLWTYQNVVISQWYYTPAFKVKSYDISPAHI